MSEPSATLPLPPAPPAPLGLIAGRTRLPLLVARGMKAMGYSVHAIGLSGQFVPELPTLCDDFHEVGVFRIGEWSRRLRNMGISHAVMVGGVDKASLMHDPLRLFRRLPDWRAALLWYRRLRHDHRSPAVLSAIADELASNGIHLIDSTLHIPEHLATVGVMTHRQPTPAQRADINFGWPLLTQALSLDIGQAIAVRDHDVIAVEAVEGTDRMIHRAGELCRASGWTLLKGAHPDHDRRADVPTIGELTIRALREAGGRCIALAAGDVIIVDKPRTLELADHLGIAVVGVAPAHHGG